MVERRCGSAVVAALLALASAGCGRGGGGAKAEGEVGAAEAAPGPVPVTVGLATRRPVERTVAVVGSLKGWEEVAVGAKKDGRVRRVGHDMGDRVRPGEVLVEMETEDADLAVRQADRQLGAELARLGLKELPAEGFDPGSVPAVVSARVKLDRARFHLARERSLQKKGAGTMQDFQNAETDEEAAEADLATAVLNVRSTLANAQAAKVRLEVARHDRAGLEVHTPSPSAAPPGVTEPVVYAVAKRSVSEGQWVRTGETVMELVIEKPLRLRLSVPERFSASVRVGQPVRVAVPSFPETTFEGEVARVNPSVDPASRTFTVEAAVPNNRGLLRPGGFAKASILTDRNAEATVVPVESIVTFAGVTKLFVVEGGKARAVAVEKLQEGTGWVEVAGDVAEGARVVVTGLTQLAEGTPVVVRTPEAETRTQAPPAIAAKTAVE